MMVLRWGLSLGLLAVTFAWIDPAPIVASLRQADPRWLAGALLASVPLMLAMAWRWSFTAQRMGIDLPLVVAWREYYASVLLNSVLPGGVAGDVVRVARQADDPARPLGAVTRSVVVERVVGQLMLWAALVVGAAWWGFDGAMLAGLLALGAVAVVGLGLGRAASHPRLSSTWLGRGLARLRTDLRAALWGPRAVAVQLVASAAGLGALVAMYTCSALAIGSSITVERALVVVPWILAATTLPLTVGGWGVRELSAAALFELVSLPAADGAASSVVFGAVSLVAALPGGVVLLWRRRGAGA